MSLKEEIERTIHTEPILLYMKGTPLQPMCGFSNMVVQILNYYGVNYKAVNIFDDPDIRTNLSEVSGWPTIPQLFIKGKLIGGADITRQLHEEGKLLDMLDLAQSVN